MKKIISIFVIVSIIFTFSSCGEIKNNNELSQIENTDGRYIIGTWINYNEINELVKSTDSYEEFSLLIGEKLETLSEYGVNTIFLHVRAFDDCFYSSQIFPVSKFCSSDDGKLKFDVLKAFIEEGHRKNIDIHAWINPYRISLDSDTSKLPEEFLPYEWYAENSSSQRLIICDRGIYYNPASVEAQKHILDGIREILTNYDVDGIHFDDYFYPSSSQNIDSDFYNEYIDNGGYLSLSDYRRQCVNTMISSVYSMIKAQKSGVIFSISPMGSIDNNMNGVFADVKLWLSKKGYADYVIPQIYFGFDNSKSPFTTTVEDWLKIKGAGAEIVIGLPFYKTAAKDNYAGLGFEEFVDNNDVISRQILYIKKKTEIRGFVYYSASGLYSENSDEIRQKELENIKTALKQENI